MTIVGSRCNHRGHARDLRPGVRRVPATIVVVDAARAPLLTAAARGGRSDDALATAPFGEANAISPNPGIATNLGTSAVPIPAAIAAAVARPRVSGVAGGGVRLRDRWGSEGWLQGRRGGGGRRRGRGRATGGGGGWLRGRRGGCRGRGAGGRTRGEVAARAGGRPSAQSEEREDDALDDGSASG